MKAVVAAFNQKKALVEGPSPWLLTFGWNFLKHYCSLSIVLINLNPWHFFCKLRVSWQVLTKRNLVSQQSDGGCLLTISPPGWGRSQVQRQTQTQKPISVSSREPRSWGCQLKSHHRTLVNRSRMSKPKQRINPILKLLGKLFYRWVFGAQYI